MIRFLILFLLMVFPAHAGMLNLQGDYTQGGLIRGQVSPDARVWLDGELVMVGNDGMFLLGFGMDAAAKSTLEIEYSSGEKIKRTLDIDQRIWQTQKINGLSNRQVTPNEDDLAQIKHDAERIWEVRDRMLNFAYFKKRGFIWPTIGRISGIFGSKRILNGKPRQPHYGVDIAAPTGTPIYAMADGVVDLAVDDMFFTGKTVMINHGHGLSSIYGHMDQVMVLHGMGVRQGDMIGKVGSSGRATGPHLHWGVSLYDVFLDPQLLVGKMPISPSANADASKTIATASP